MISVVLKLIVAAFFLIATSGWAGIPQTREIEGNAEIFNQTRIISVQEGLETTLQRIDGMLEIKKESQERLALQELRRVVENDLNSFKNRIAIFESELREFEWRNEAFSLFLDKIEEIE